MSTLLEIESAAAALSAGEKAELLLFVAGHPHQPVNHVFADASIQHWRLRTSSHYRLLQRAFHRNATDSDPGGH